MPNVRKLANRALLAGSMLALPACGNALVAKPPSSVKPIQTDTNLYEKAHISKNQDFEQFEPILENMANERPVPWTRVSFLSGSEFSEKCSSLAGACYRPPDDEIVINQRKLLPTILFCGNAGCPKETYDIWAFGSWLHEQGHHYDRYYGHVNSRTDAWLNEVEAVAFEFYFGEHMAKHYDARLGLSLLSKEHGHNAWPIPSQSAEILRRQKWRYEGGEFDRGYAIYSVYSLLGVGFSSFGDVWYFIHKTPHDELQKTIIRYLPYYELGKERSKSIYCNLARGTQVKHAEMYFSFCENPESASETDF